MKLRRCTAADWDWTRLSSANEDAMARVREIVRKVKASGDAAVRSYTAEFDGWKDAGNPANTLRVPVSELKRAWDALDAALKDALTRAAERIRHFHQLQVRAGVDFTGSEGDRMGMTFRPLHRVGVYAPGGRAAYPSTVLMNVVPAQVAGVTEIALVSPPQRDTGLPHALVMAAAHLLGVTEVYRMGGAQAVAALAYGTAEVPRVDKVVGPGNLYVALAKRAVMGDVGIDSIAGPSEVFIVADETANPAYVAADMLAQAEHDPEAGAVCVTTAPALAGAVESALQAQLEQLPRRDIAEQALRQWGAIVTAETLDEAVAVVNRSAPEHVELLVHDANPLLQSIHSAGAVFLGAYSPEPVGDYYAGTNHVLPTHGSARYASGLGVDDFVRRMTYVEYSAATLRAHAGDIVTLAEAEGLHGHANSILIRMTGDDAQ